MSGGNRGAATRKFVEVSCRIRDTLSSSASPKYSTFLKIDLSKEDNSIALNNEIVPFDIVTIIKSPAYKEQLNLTFEREVIYSASFCFLAAKKYYKIYKLLLVVLMKVLTPKVLLYR